MLASYQVYKIFQEAGVPDGNESFFIVYLYAVENNASLESISG